jgi:hypothetical protein
MSSSLRSDCVKSIDGRRGVGTGEGGGSALDFLYLFVRRISGDELGLLKLDTDIGS